MIDADVQELAESFAKRFQSVGEFVPEIQFDGSWPSIGNLETLLIHLRYAQHLSEKDTALILASAAYLGTHAYKIWEQFDTGLMLTLTSIAEPSPDIVLSAQGGQFLEADEKFSISLVKSITEILLSPPQPFPVFESFRRELPIEYPLFSLFATGVCSGLSQFGTGGWKNRTLAEFEPYLDVFLNCITVSTAEYYARVHPDEPIGASPEFYDKLLMPPLLFNEPLLGVRPATELMNFFSNSAYTREQVLTVAQNLARMPDETLSATGIIVTCALSDAVGRTFRLLMESKSSIAYMYRPAIVMLRSAAGLPADWLHAAFRGAAEHCQTMAEIEFQYTLLPNCFFPPSLLLQNTFAQKEQWIEKDEELVFLKSLAYSHLPTALAAGRALETKYPKDFLLLSQLCFLELIAGEGPEFERRLATLPSTDGFRPSLYHELAARFALATEDVKTAVAELQKGMAAPAQDGLRSGILADLLVISARLDGDDALAERISDRAMNRNEVTLKTFHNRMETLYLKDELEELRRTIGYLKRIVPCDPMIMRYLSWMGAAK